mgnify:CR=1 FL=1
MTDERLCQFCGHVGEVIECHGHIQCGRCRQNIDPCCQGEAREICEQRTETESE